MLVGVGGYEKGEDEEGTQEVLPRLDNPPWGRIDGANNWHFVSITQAVFSSVRLSHLLSLTI